VVLVQPGWYDPGSPVPDSIASLGVEETETPALIGDVPDYGLADPTGRIWDNVIVADQAAFANVKVGGLEATKIEADLATLASLRVENVGTSFRIENGSIVFEGAQGESVFRVDSLGNAFLKGILTADGIRANQIEGLDILAKNIITDSLQTMSFTSQSTGSSNLAGNVLGAEDLAITGSLTASGSSTFAGESIFKSLVMFWNNIIVRGNALFEGNITVNNDTAGTAIIPASSMSVYIPFETPFNAAPIVTISLVVKSATDSAFLGDGTRAAVADVTTSGFTILLDMAVPRDLEYNWVALAVKNPRRIVGTGIGIVPTPIESGPSATPTPTEGPTPVASPPPELISPTPTIVLTPTPIESGPTPSIVPVTVTPTSTVTPIPSPTP
jgi:hypothetical protein